MKRGAGPAGDIRSEDGGDFQINPTTPLTPDETKPISHPRPAEPPIAPTKPNTNRADRTQLPLRRPNPIAIAPTEPNRNRADRTQSRTAGTGQ